MTFQTKSRLILLAMFYVTMMSCADVFSEPHQTATFSPILSGDDLPYQVTVRPYDFDDASLPTLHSYAAATHAGKWVILAGRTNGLHGFDQNPFNNFPAASQNRDVWVIDPVAKQSWHRSLAGLEGGLTEEQVSSITPTNNQFYQQGDQLYMSGGYGLRADGDFGTFDTLTAIELPGIVDWVQNGNGMAADHVRQIQHAAVQVTGGAMYAMQGRTHIVFGQNFIGGYTAFGHGIYTEQVRSFDIVDDGQVLSIEDVTMTEPAADYRRRDLNVTPVIRPEGDGTLAEELVVYSGVFTKYTGAWTVPVEIDGSGQPSMADPAAVETFKQGMNNYHSAKFGMYSEATGMMHQLFFGGISLQYLDDATGEIMTDDAMPFVNDITAIVSDAGGSYSQYRVGRFPELLDGSGNPWRFGTNAEFFPAAGVEMYDNGVLNLESLSNETVVGYIFGGIAANAPHTRGVEGAVSVGSNLIFEVVVTNVPEPSSAVLALWLAAYLAMHNTGKRLLVTRNLRQRLG
jgi:hypothetical protein